MMKWLVSCDDVSVPETLRASNKPIECTELISAPNIPVVDNGEQLVNVAEHVEVLWVYSWLPFYRRPTQLLLREGLIDRLVRAAESLPDELHLVVLDGWRPRSFQLELHSYYSRALARDVTGYVSDPSPGDGAIPPHCTGGAVDLTLTWRGAPLGLGSDFDEFSVLASVEQPSDTQLTSRSVALRAVLADALAASGLTPYPLEWWHWSYGDQLWAHQVGEAAAIYGEALSSV